ncbi:MAG: DUF3179 domain-containing protein [Phycisphaerales bacterium]|nr:DUF3179 domain-containing protein [Phycisphaerales bacterium]
MLLSAVLCVALLAWAFAGVLFGTRPIGDGRSVASYGFSLADLEIGEGILAASGNPRDFLPALDDPRSVPGGEVLEINRHERGKFIVSSDRVIGVVVNGAARAYPIRLMNAHEVVNDTLGGEPIVVTYSGLCDSAVVASRRIGDRTVRFRVSGLLLNSNLVMYDLDDAEPSLWSQLEARAISGPAARAGDRLSLLPGTQVVAWDTWLAAHPDTTVMERDPASVKRYKDIDYRRYWSLGELMFDAAPLPEPAALERDGLTLMTPVVAVEAGGERRTYPYPWIAQRAANAPWTAQQGDVTLTFLWHPAAGTVEVVPTGPGADRTVLVHARYFAWFAATDGGVDLTTDGERREEAP